MPANNPSPNGGLPDKLNAFVEPVDSSELEIDEIPTVEVAVLPKPRNLFWAACFWFVLFAGLFLGFFQSIVAVAHSHYSKPEKALLGILSFMAFGGLGLAGAVFSACHRGFTFGKACLWCLLFFLATQGSVLILTLIVASQNPEIHLADPNWMSLPSAGPVLEAVTLTLPVVTIVFSLAVLRLAVGRDWKRKIGLRLPSLEHVLLVIVAMPALLLVGSVLETEVVKYLPTFGKFGMSNINDVMKQTASWPWAIAVLAIGIGPAIGEDLWCRGFLGQGLASRYGRPGAVLLSSLFFGMIHADPAQAVPAFFMGIVFYLAYLASRSIVIPMLMHFTNNTLAVLAESQTGPVALASSLDLAYDSRPRLMLAAALVVLIIVGLILYRSRVRIWAPEGGEVPAPLYPNVECPTRSSANKAEAGPLPAAAVGALIVAACFFGAVWFGL